MFSYNPLSQLLTHFLHKQLQLSSSTIQRIERRDATAFKVKAKVDTLTENLQIQQRERVPIISHQRIARKFNSRWLADEFYSTALEYVQEWAHHLTQMNSMSWVALSKHEEWKSVSSSLDNIRSVFPMKQLIDMDNQFDEIVYLKRYIKEKITTRNDERSSMANRYGKEMFQHFHTEHNLLGNMKFQV
jgi:hypothetical protein